MKKEYRAYTWGLVAYGYKTEELENTLQELVFNKYITTYAFIYHDKDIYTQEDKDQAIKDNREYQEPNTIKKPHHHIIIIFKQNVSRNQIITRFIKQDLENNKTILTKQVIDKYSAYRYLTHKDNPEKVQYKEEDIHSWTIQQFKGKLTQSEETTKYINMYEDYKSGETMRNMIIKYGRDYILNYDNYKKYFELMQIQENKN